MPLTVLQVIPNLGAGGSEQACIDIAAALKARGDKALVVSAGGQRVSEIIQSGGKHYVHNVASKNPLAILVNAIWLARFMRAHKVDIIHVRSRAPAWSGWIAGRLAKRSFVTTFHAAYKYSNPLKKFYNRVMTRSDRIIAISNFIADHIKNSYGISANKVRVIYRGIDLNKFAPDSINENRKDSIRRSWSVSPDQRLLLLPARLSAIKGQDLLIQAVALLPPEFYNVTAVILGDDQGRTEYRRKLQGVIHSLKLANRIKLVDHCNDMPAAYAVAELVVVPSSVPEGFGRVPVEAMAMGIPVIASNLGATQETVIEGETGWLLPPESPKLWAAAIVKALNLTTKQKDRMKECAVKRAHALFDRSQMIDRTLAVYDELVGKGV